MLDVRGLSTLLVVLERGSFAAAAAELGYTPSAVSQQIAQLERSLGVKLFDRGAKSIRPTAAASSVALRARGVLDALVALEMEARSAVSGSSRVLRIGSFPSAGAEILPRALVDLRAQEPELSFTLDEMSLDDLLARLESGSLDVALVYEYGLAPLTPSATVRTANVFRERLVLAAPREMKPAGDVHIRDFIDSTWIAANERSGGSRALLRMFRQFGVRPTIALHSDDYSTVLSLVSAGEGVAIVPELALSRPFAGRAWLLEGTGMYRDVQVAHRVGRPDPVLRAFTRSVRRATESITDRVSELSVCRV